MPIAEEIMVKDVITFTPEDTILKVIACFAEHDISGAPVVYAERIVGIVSERDIIEFCRRKGLEDIYEYLSLPTDPEKMPEKLTEILYVFRQTKVQEIMSQKVITAKSNLGINEIAKLMHNKEVNRIPIVDKEGKLIGIVTRHGIIKAFWTK